VLALVEKKAAGETLEAPPEEPAPAQVVSLADALSASLAAARKRADEPAHPPAPSRGSRRHAAPAAARTARRPRKKKQA
jgi:DNA end-binding protein Ku